MLSTHAATFTEHYDGKSRTNRIGPSEMHPPCQRISLGSIPFVRLASRKTNPRKPFAVRSWPHAVGTAGAVWQKMMCHADAATTIDVYGKAMVDSKLDAHTKLLEYGCGGFAG
jgi:hypothetical protein